MVGEGLAAIFDLDVYCLVSAGVARFSVPRRRSIELRGTIAANDGPVFRTVRWVSATGVL